MIEVGTEIRDYRFITRIGEGGMGEVWLAEDTSLERKVAIKILAPEFTRSSDLIARFKQEAKLQANLIHKNIVTLHTFFEEQGQYFMVMEYARGITIKELIQQIGPIPEDRVIGILNQILDALAYAHDKGIIHRDIKPSNIMIYPDKGDFVKIMDFGIAKVLGDKGLTRTGTRMGTLYYMSPEQIRAEKDIDQRTDIYSLGITLFEMLTGKLPFDTDTESDYTVQHQIITTEIPNPNQLVHRLNEQLCALIISMTPKNKNQRPFIKLIIDQLGSIERSGKTSQTKIEIEKSRNNITEAQITTTKPNIELQPRKMKSVRLVVVSIIIIIVVLSILVFLPRKSHSQSKSDSASFIDMVMINSISLKISKTEITQDQWLKIMGTNPSAPSNYISNNFPVESVSWYDAVKFCNKLSVEEGRTPCYSINGFEVSCNWVANGYRLPTEAEWVYAASANSYNRLYSGSDDIDLVAWYLSNSEKLPHEVGTKSPNEFGLFDMSGNVWEWCWDWYDKSNYNSEIGYKGPDKGTYKVIKGGGFHDTRDYCKVLKSSYYKPSSQHFDIGFRVCRSE
jgi:serine/threonine protein kinase